MRLFPALMSALVLFLASPLAKADEKAVPGTAAVMQLSFAPLVKATAPAVVNVYSQRKLVEKKTDSFSQDPFFRRFFGGDGSFGRPRERVASSLGSGVIVDPNGLIVTNNHVIANATDIKVCLLYTSDAADE